MSAEQQQTPSGAEARITTPGPSETSGFSGSKRERTNTWPRPPKRLRGGKAEAQGKADRAIAALVEALTLTLERRG